MDVPEFAVVGDVTEIIQQVMPAVSNYIEYLLELSNDPQRHGELISVLDPTIDKLEQHVMALHNRLLEELDKRVGDFEIAIKALNSLSTMIGSQPPDCLSEIDKEHWHKLAVSGVLQRQLVSFKESLLDDFKDSTFEQLQITELTDKNMAIRKVLDKIQQVLII